MAFDKTGRMVSPVGLGGEGVLRSYDRGEEAEAVIRAALAKGITLPIVGCSTSDEVAALTKVTEKGPLPAEQTKKLVEHYRPYAAKMAFCRGVR